MYYSRVLYVLFSRRGEGSRINEETGKFRQKMINAEAAINWEVGKNLQS